MLTSGGHTRGANCWPLPYGCCEHCDTDARTEVLVDLVEFVDVDLLERVRAAELVELVVHLVKDQRLVVAAGGREGCGREGGRERERECVCVCVCACVLVRVSERWKEAAMGILGIWAYWVCGHMGILDMGSGVTGCVCEGWGRGWGKSMGV